jgi:hypothetical protein
VKRGSDDGGVVRGLIDSPALPFLAKPVVLSTQRNVVPDTNSDGSGSLVAIRAAPNGGENKGQRRRGREDGGLREARKATDANRSPLC